MKIKITCFFLAICLFFINYTCSSQQWRVLVTEDFGPADEVMQQGAPTNTSQDPAGRLLPGTTTYAPIVNPYASINDGEYKVVNISGRGDNAWINGAYDHTTNNGSGYMMMINANPGKQGEANGQYYLYSTSVFDVPGAIYDMGFWGANMLQTTNTGKNAYIGISIRNTPNATGTLYGNNTWILPRTTNNAVLPWVNRTLQFTLPTTYAAGTPLYFNFFNSDNNASIFGNDLFIDDITIRLQVVTVSGTVFNDYDADGLIDAGEPGFNGTTIPTYAYITKSNGTIISKVQVNANGTYTFSIDQGIPASPSNIGMKVLISSQNLAVGGNITSSSITRYANISEESNGSTAVNKGIVDGAMTITNSTSNFTNINFGLDALPESYAVAKTVTGAPVVGQPVTLTDAPLQGSDTLVSPARASWSGKSVNIASLPTNGFDLYYNGIKITAADIGSTGFTITNYDPSKLTLQATATTPAGTKSTSFGYSVIDNQGQKDPTPATFTLNYTIALPVHFGSITAVTEDGVLKINWTSLLENNNDHYEIEASVNGTDFKKIGTVSSKAPDGQSATPLSYEFSTDVNETDLLAGVAIGLFGICLLFSRKKNKLLFSAMLLVGLCVSIGSCKKSKNEITTDGQKLYIRILQVDKNGDTSYSKIVTVVNN